jgi:hypothetical protein
MTDMIAATAVLSGICRSAAPGPLLYVRSSLVGHRRNKLTVPIIRKF